jgi:predicted dehydrogenase
MENNETYSVVLIGLGNVGVFYDIGDLTGKKYLTHAKAFSKHARFDLIAGIDPNDEARATFTKAYSRMAFASLDDVESNLEPDVVVISSPTDFHLDSIEKVFRYWRPKAVLCEKPLAYNYPDARRILEVCNTYNTQLFVNFFRVCDPSTTKVRQIILDNFKSPYFSGVAWYSKGLKANGVHFVNLLQDLFGDVTSIKIISSGRRLKPDDLEPEFELRFGSGKVVFLPCKSEDYFHNSIEVIASGGRLRYDNSGMKVIWQSAEEDTRFPGYVRLSSKERDISPDYDRIQLNVVEQLLNALDGKPATICSGRTALNTQAVITQIETLTNEDDHHEHSR